MWLFHLHSAVKIQPFYPFFPLAGSTKHFAGYPFGTSRKKASTFSITRASLKAFEGDGVGGGRRGRNAWGCSPFLRKASPFNSSQSRPTSRSLGKPPSAQRPCRRGRRGTPSSAASLGSVGAILTACASAWRIRARMMPSVRDSRKNASTASLSVTLTYSARLYP